MGNRRGTLAAACVLGVGLLALAGAGCGAEEHVNDPRPQPPTRVSVTVSEDAITVQPRRIAIGPEPTQQIPQNANVEQPYVRSNAPVDVVFVAANLTDVESRLEVRGNGQEATSQRLVANGSITLQTALPTGIYTVRAANVRGVTPGRFTVGPFRTSSENDVLLP